MIFRKTQMGYYYNFLFILCERHLVHSLMKLPKQPKRRRRKKSPLYKDEGNGEGEMDGEAADADTPKARAIAAAFAAESQRLGVVMGGGDEDAGVAEGQFELRIIACLGPDNVGVNKTDRTGTHG